MKLSRDGEAMETHSSSIMTSMLKLALEPPSERITDESIFTHLIWSKKLVRIWNVTQRSRALAECIELTKWSMIVDSVAGSPSITRPHMALSWYGVDVKQPIVFVMSSGSAHSSLVSIAL
jgi:hypothetical protein